MRCHYLRPTAHACFEIDVLEMLGHGPRAYRQSQRNLTIGQTFRQQRHHIGFSPGQLGGGILLSELVSGTQTSRRRPSRCCLDRMPDRVQAFQFGVGEVLARSVQDSNDVTVSS